MRECLAPQLSNKFRSKVLIRQLLPQKIVTMVKQFLPIIFPSWRFFSGIGASPRIELGFIFERDETPDCWVAFRPIPRNLSVVQHIIRLFHNPRWNELLFINTCAERLFDAMDDADMDEIARRLLTAIVRGEVDIPGKQTFLVFRIRALYSEDAPANRMGNIGEEIVAQSRPYKLNKQETNE